MEDIREKSANKIDGIVALAIANLEAVRAASQMPLIMGVF